MASPSRTARIPIHPSASSSPPMGVPPIVLAIGGSDSSAGAGIQADLKAIAAHGGYARTVVTAVMSVRLFGCAHSSHSK